MNEGQKLMERAKKKLHTYTAVAEYLNLSNGMVGHVVSGRKFLPPFHASRLAELLGEDPETWTRLALAETARTQQEKSYWLAKIKEVAKASATAAAISIALLGPAKLQMQTMGSKDLCHCRTRRRGKTARKSGAYQRIGVSVSELLERIGRRPAPAL